MIHNIFRFVLLPTWLVMDTIQLLSSEKQIFECKKNVSNLWISIIENVKVIPHVKEYLQVCVHYLPSLNPKMHCTVFYNILWSWTIFPFFVCWNYLVCIKKCYILSLIYFLCCDALLSVCLRVRYKSVMYFCQWSCLLPFFCRRAAE